MTFPGANASIITNDEGEPIGWDYPALDDHLEAAYEDRFDFDDEDGEPFDSDYDDIDED